LKPCKRIEVLDLPALALDQDDIARLVAQFPDLKALRCNVIGTGNPRNIPLEAICKTLSRLSQLKALSLKLRWGYGASDTITALTKCRSLEYVEIEGVRVQDILALATKCPRLVTVVLPSYSWGSMAGIQEGSFTEAVMPWLRQSTKTEEALLAQLKPLTHVRTVVLSTTAKTGGTIRTTPADVDAFTETLRKAFPDKTFAVERGHGEWSEPGPDSKKPWLWNTHVPDPYPGQQELFW
jgi:hypothetical protein